MKLSKIVTTSAIVSILSTSLWVQAQAQTNDQASAPMDSLMMQNMMQMRQQHMDKMEKRLARIESLLSELLENQRKNK